MTIPVEFAQLAKTLESFDHAYLLTVSADGIVKVNAVDPVLTADAVVIEAAGLQARLNAEHNPAVTLVWPPTVRHGHTLIVDGTAVVADTSIVIHQTSGLLHRPGAHADGPAWAG
jgi:hypothetical protein